MLSVLIEQSNNIPIGVRGAKVGAPNCSVLRLLTVVYRYIKVYYVILLYAD